MILRITFSITILIAPIAIYYWIIRPRLQAKFTEIYAGVDGFWARLWTRLTAFKTFVVGTVGVYLSEAPALLEELRFADLTSLPDHWQSTIRIGTMILIMVMRALDTKPGEEK